MYLYTILFFALVALLGIIKLCACLIAAWDDAYNSGYDGGYNDGFLAGQRAERQRPDIARDWPGPRNQSLPFESAPRIGGVN